MQKTKENIYAFLILALFIVTMLFLKNMHASVFIYAGVLFILMVYEILASGFISRNKVSKPERWFINFSIHLLTSTIVTSFTLIAIQICSIFEIGLFNIYNVHPVIIIVLSILLFDFLNFIQHWYSHKNVFLWKCHSVHHTDLVFDISMTGRDHPIMAFYVLLARIIVVTFLGIPVYAFALYILFATFTTPFIHSNIKIPSKLDKIIRKVFVTPSLHYIHHSSNMADANVNFSIGFSFWDRLFNTYKTSPEKGYEATEVGLDEYPSQKDLSLSKLLMLPFKK